MPARRTATPLIFTTLVIAAFMSATAVGCSHGSAHVRPATPAAQTR